jgi:hypothetical protein
VSPVATAPPRLAQLPLSPERAEPRAPAPEGGSSHERLRRSGGGRLTLERRLDRVWEGLLAAGAAECPMCGAAMERYGDAGHCGGCGTALS